MENNDKRIMELKTSIDAKRKSIKEFDKFSPKTNCILTLDTITYNLNVLTETGLVLLLSTLNNYKLTVKELELQKLETLCGFNVNDWIDDIKSKIKSINTKNEIANLKSMENKLTQLLSEQKKTELLLDDIENNLK